MRDSVDSCEILLTAMKYFSLENKYFTIFWESSQKLDGKKKPKQNMLSSIVKEHQAKQAQRKEEHGKKHIVNKSKNFIICLLNVLNRTKTKRSCISCQ